MKKLLLIFLISLFAFVAKAQNVITVVHSGTSTFYTNLDTAIVHASNGDNIYIPGGTYSLNGQINKGVNLIGVGYNLDSTSATGATVITSSNNFVKIVTGADNGSLTGIGFYSPTTVEFGTSAANETVNSFSITRCRINVLELGYYGTTTTSANFYISENIIDNVVDGAYIQNCNFSKNIFANYLYHFGQSNEFANNIFLITQSNNPIEYTSNSDFKNNIFMDSSYYILWTSLSNTLENNLFVGSSTTIDNNEGTFVNCLYSIYHTSIFVSYNGSSAFSYSDDFHLKSSCPGKSYGTDGTDLGIYGTASPFKTGGVPGNPHIQNSLIPNSTDGNGNLDVNIKVEAQDH